MVQYYPDVAIARLYPDLFEFPSVKVQRMKHYAFAIATLLASTVVPAFDVSENTLNQFVESKLSEKKYSDLHLTSPKITLQDGYATFCAAARPKIYPRDISFCAHLTPKWRKETGSLLATRMLVTSLSVPGVDVQQIELVRMLANRSVLPALEGIELYRADDAIGKQISSVTVMQGKLDLEF
jgi:hypothetical protein